MDRQIDGQIDRQIRYIDRLDQIKLDQTRLDQIRLNRQTDKQTNKTDKQTNQTNKQTNKLTSKQTDDRQIKWAPKM